MARCVVLTTFSSSFGTCSPGPLARVWKEFNCIRCRLANLCPAPYHRNVVFQSLVARPKPKSSLTLLADGREREGFRVFPWNFSSLLDRSEYDGWLTNSPRNFKRAVVNLQVMIWEPQGRTTRGKEDEKCIAKG